MSGNHFVNMWLRVRRAFDNTINNYFYNTNTSREREDTPINLSPRYSYSRPIFLHLHSKEDINTSLDHIGRPIITPHKEYLPWMAGYAECINSGKSKYNEDQATSYEFNLPGKWGPYKDICHDIPITYFGVFDGHGGYGAALHASKLLHKLVENNIGSVTDEIWEDIIGTSKHKHRSELVVRITLDDLIIGALEQAFLEMDDIIGQNRYLYLPSGGCTALVVLMFLNKVYVANAGDCRAVHCKDKRSNPLSNDMTPETDAIRIKRLAQIHPSSLEGKYNWFLYEHKPKRSELGKQILFKDAWSQGWLAKTVDVDDLKDPIISGKGKRSRLMKTVAVSRGFGDHDLRSKETKVPVKPFLTARAEVAWMHFEQSAILTVHNHVITRNPRISVTHDKHRTWFLHIFNVQEEDKGRYMCQINTVTAKTQFGYLHVVVPPNIDDSMSSSDVIVREGANETLTCKATGSPIPSVKWKRDDNTKININKTLSVLEWEGETLELTRISRLDMGAYLCIASNGVPPTVSKRIKVSVDFPPMLWIPHQLVGAPLAYSVTLECFTEAHPTSLNYWTREDGHMIHESRKYHTENIVGNPAYKTHMRLTIANIENSDYGTYKCVAKNPRGETDGTIRLYTSSPPTTSPRPTTTETPRAKDSWSGQDGVPFNNSVYGNPSSLTVHLTDKGSKYQSILNEIDKSEQKLNSDMDSKGSGIGYEYPSVKSSVLGNLRTGSTLTVLSSCIPMLIRFSLR